MSNFTFLNHASYMIETEKSILLVDPWVEGYAFDKGWSLLDKSTTNEELLNHLSNIKKEKFIWLSHEHSDHFSVPFLMGLKKRGEQVTFLFQKTLDGRVATFIRKIGFNVTESNDLMEIIDDELSVVTFPFQGGDSYCLTMWKDYSILNMNDCVVADDLTSNSVVHNYKKYTNKVDLLLTQFGYANWLGNKDENQLRVSSSIKTLKRIKLQVERFDPESVIPFASFVYFNHIENFHTNDCQNSPKDVDSLFTKNKINSNLIVLKPWDELDLSLDLENQNKILRASNIEHWGNLLSNIEPDVLEEIKYSIKEIDAEYKNYKNRLFKSFLLAPFFLEKIKFLQPITFYVYDLDINVTLSYVKGFRTEQGNKLASDISLSSATLVFVLKNEYGSNTTHVNGKFERLSITGVNKFSRHFAPQEYMKMGYGLNHPFTTSFIVIGKLFHKWKDKKWRINPSWDY